MKLELNTDDFHYAVAKCEIFVQCENPWIRGFLKYIQDKPKASPAEMCRDMFCDNGKAREAAIKNILFFFETNGLLEKNPEGGFGLTQDGLKALDAGNVWQGRKGTFLLTIWTPDELGAAYVLNVQGVPDFWDGKEDFGDLENFVLCDGKVKMPLHLNSLRKTYVDTVYDGKVSLEKKKIKICGVPDPKTRLKPYETVFELSDELRTVLFQECADEF